MAWAAWGLLFYWLCALLKRTVLRDLDGWMDVAGFVCLCMWVCVYIYTVIPLSYLDEREFYFVKADIVRYVVAWGDVEDVSLPYGGVVCGG